MTDLSQRGAPGQKSKREGKDPARLAAVAAMPCCMSAAEAQRKLVLFHARQMRDIYQREVDRLEAMDQMARVSTGSE